MILDETDDTGDQQLVKARGRIREMIGGMKQKLHRLGEYGIAYHAPKGSIGTASMANGSPSSAFLSNFEHPDYRPKGLLEGEVKVYDKNGQYVHLKADGTTVINGGGCQIIMKNGKIILVGNVYLGAEDASRPVSAQGTIDDGGFVDTDNELTKVWGK